MKKSNHVFIQTLVPDVEPIEGRRPLRQTMIEMACYLKNQLSEKTGAVLKTRFNPVSKWQRMNGAQTELVIYEDKSAAIKGDSCLYLIDFKIVWLIYLIKFYRGGPAK